MTKARSGPHRIFKPRDVWRQHHNANGRPKLPWNTEHAARAHALSHESALSVYRCELCDSFHVGVTRNPHQWMADAIIDEIEFGARVVAHLRREQLGPRGVMLGHAKTLERIRKREAA